MEDSPSGLWRTLGKRVGVTASRVRISYPPPGLEPRKPLKSFGFRGFALVPSDCRFPPGSLRFDTFGPDPPRVSHIGTDDSENAFEPSPAVCSSSKSDRVPCVPSVGRFESLHVFRAVFFVLVRNNPSLRIASASQRIPVGPARRFPLTPSDERHTNAYGCHESPFEPSINSLIHRQEAKERSWRTGAGVATSLSDRPRRTSTPSSERDIEVPAPLADKIREHLATYVDKKPTALLFTGVRTRGTIGDYD